MPIPQQRQCVLGNHEFFIGRHDVDRDLAIRARDPPRVTGVLGRVERHPEPLEPLRNPCPNADGIFTDACGEDETIDTLQCRGQHSGLQSNPVDEIVDGKRRMGIAAVLKLTHVVTDAGKPLQPAIAVKKILHPSGRHALFGHQVQDDAGIDLAGARSHRKSIERGEAHRALYAASAVHGAHGSAASKMRHDHPAPGDFGCNARQGLCDILIGKTMKSVTANSLLVQPAGYGVVVRDLVVAAVKGRVKAGDLRQSRKFGKQGSDRRQIVGLMQRCKCRQPLKTRDHAMIDQYGAIVVGTTMDDAMADGERA